MNFKKMCGINKIKRKKEKKGEKVLKKGIKKAPLP